MNEYKRIMQIRWSDLDPNLHVRHSVYYDWGATCRIDFLNEHHLTTEVMQGLGIGPILFREECVFRKEIRSGDEVEVYLSLLKARNDFSRWTVQHHFFKKEKELCAVLTIDGAWLNITERKLATPPEQVSHVFQAMPKSPEFTFL